MWGPEAMWGAEVVQGKDGVGGEAKGWQAQEGVRG